MEVHLDRDSFLKGLQMVQNIVEPRQALPILANVLIQAGGEAIRVTATDLEVGGSVSIPAKVVSPGAITLSARKLVEIVKELPVAMLSMKVQDNARVLGSSEEVQLALVENQFVLRMPNFVMLARLIEGQFPNYEQVLPKGHPRRVTMSRAALSAGLRRVSIMADERTRPVKMVFAPGTLKLMAYHQDLGEAEETLEVAYTGDEVTIGFNSRYLLEALAPLEADQVVFEFNDGMSPGVLKSFEEEGTLCVIMPMRI